MVFDARAPSSLAAHQQVSSFLKDEMMRKIKKENCSSSRSHYCNFSPVASLREVHFLLSSMVHITKAAKCTSKASYLCWFFARIFSNPFFLTVFGNVNLWKQRINSQARKYFVCDNNHLENVLHSWRYATGKYFTNWKQKHGKFFKVKMKCVWILNIPHLVHKRCWEYFTQKFPQGFLHARATLSA